ncbi:MAG: LacI family DNA-binding transcriptional regulator [Opitutus sp.]
MKAPPVVPATNGPANATLQDVANRAGVHRSTAALALRDNRRISAETRRRVQEIARELRYQLNPLVAALMQSRRSGKPLKHVSLAYVTNYPTRFGWRPEHHDRPDFFPGAEKRAMNFGYKVEHFWLREPGMTAARFCDILSVRGIHGLIIGRLPPGELTLQLDWGRFASVALGLTLRSPLLHHVTENHFEAASLALRQCLARGYRRIGFVYSEANDSPEVGERWHCAYAGAQLKLRAADRVPVCPGDPANEEEFIKWFRSEKPDALLVTHARPVIGWLKRLRLQVPGAVGLVDLAGDHPELNCAGVYCDAAQIGRLGVEMLIGLLHRSEFGVPAARHEILLTGQWREGTTLRRISQ